MISKTRSALFWSLAEAMGIRSVHFVIGIVLARLLLPEQFGLIGMLMIFTAVAQTLLDSGFGAALIQKRAVDADDTNSIFYFNLLAGIAAAATLSAAAPLVASFYRQPLLAPLLRVCSLTLVINAVGMIQNSLLVKAIDFRTLFKISFSAALLSGIVGIVMASRGYGVWSLVGQQLADSSLRTILLWFFSTWRPAWRFSLQALRELFGFGSKLLAANLLHALFDNIYKVVIGKLFTAAELGNYTMARDIQHAPATTLPRVVGRVLFPVFATLQDDPAGMKRGTRKALTLLAAIHFPLMLGLAIVARPTVLLLLTAKWEPCVLYLQLLCVVGLMYPLHLINLQVLQAMGRSDLFLQLELIKKGLIILNIVVTWRWGVTALLGGHIGVSAVSYWLNAYHNKRLIDYSVTGQLHDLLPHMATALATALFMYCISLAKAAPPLLLLIQVTGGLLLYAVLCRLFHPGVYAEIRRLIAEKCTSRTKA